MAAQDATRRPRSSSTTQQYQKRIFDKLAQEQAVREEDVEQWLTRVNAAQATNDGSGSRSSNALKLQVQIRD